MLVLAGERDAMVVATRVESGMLALKGNAGH